MGRVAVLLVILFCCELLLVDKVRCSRYLPDEDLDVNLKNDSEDSYECVDIHKQIAFQHPLLKNHTIDSDQVLATPLLYKDSGNDFATNITSVSMLPKTEMCPKGTIPIRKMQAFESKLDIRPISYYAIARTVLGRGRYAGGGGGLKTNNPKVVGQQFSAVRIRVQGGDDSIEAGWRVDPALYGDSLPRFFIFTDAGRTRCFNTRCPGFIQKESGFDLGFPLGNVSKPGTPSYSLTCYIIRNNGNGNWNLVLGEEGLVIGYWPSRIFTGLKGLAERVDWGATVYSPPGTPLPMMGYGKLPTGIPDSDGAVSNIKVENEKGDATERFDFELFANNPRLYAVLDRGYPAKGWGRVILFGGPGH